VTGVTGNLQPVTPSHSRFPRGSHPRSVPAAGASTTGILVELVEFDAAAATKTTTRRYRGPAGRRDRGRRDPPARHGPASGHSSRLPAAAPRWAAGPSTPWPEVHDPRPGPTSSRVAKNRRSAVCRRLQGRSRHRCSPLSRHSQGAVACGASDPRSELARGFLISALDPRGVDLQGDRAPAAVAEAPGHRAQIGALWAPGGHDGGTRGPKPLVEHGQ
jgi:hypothetical protein